VHFESTWTFEDSEGREDEGDDSHGSSDDDGIATGG